ncbi:MAG: hypothetical protein COB15_06985 [Flavobacteriales bacterium]|nr:MAG: hypothetical protein COB15_06985 [Flavobacteriales bacterium]
MKTNKKILQKIRRTVTLFIVLLVLSGVTAFPLQTELNFLVDSLTPNSGLIYQWLSEVSTAINDINANYPFLAYGTDWLAFSHIVISIFFIGVYIDPVRNIWITHTGIIACLLVFPVAFIAGYIRNIPLFWQLIDCCFGALGLIPLILIHKNTKELKPQY